MRLFVLVLLLSATIHCVMGVSLEKRLHNSQKKSHVAATLEDQLITAFAAFGQVLGSHGRQVAMAENIAAQFPTIMTEFAEQLLNGRKVPSLLDNAKHEPMFLDSVTLFFTRVTADYADLIAAFTLDGAFVIESVKIFSNDPHHEQRRVIIFTTTGGKQVVYKPATQDASFFFTSNAPESFLTMYNQWIPTYKLYTYPVVRKSDGEGHYGYIDFISQEKGALDSKELKVYSYTAGLLLAAQLVCGVTDMHIENMMTHRVGSGNVQAVVIDAETMFTPMTDFSVRNVGVFEKVGAFWNHKMHGKDHFKGDRNSVITFKGIMGHPPEPNMLLKGLKDGFKYMGQNKNDILNWINNVVEDASYYRYVPVATVEFRDLNVLNLISPTFNCKSMTKSLGSLINTDSKWRYIGFMRDNCAVAEDIFDRDDVPAVWLRHGNAKIYFPDLTNELSLAGLDYAGSSLESFYDNKIATYGDTANTDLLEQTLKSISVARINMAVQADGSTPDYILTPLKVELKRIDDLMKTFAYTS